MDGNPPAVPIRPLLPTRAKFAQIVQAANGGDSKALSELRRLLNEHPAIWRNVGDLASLAGTLLLRSASGGNSLIGGSITRYIRQLRTEQLIQPQTGCGSKFKPEIAAGTDMLTVVPATFTFLGILKIDR